MAVMAASQSESSSSEETTFTASLVAARTSLAVGYCSTPAARPRSSATATPRLAVSASVGRAFWKLRAWSARVLTIADAKAASMSSFRCRASRS